MSVIPLKVAVRVRPLIQKETDEGCQKCVNFIPGEQQIVLGKDRSFSYDYVFRPDDPQISVYEDAVQPLIKHIFKGYNATVLAYGQTGSGKTFTMGGGYEASLKMDPDMMGIIPRIIQEIFTRIEEEQEREYTINVSYLEIINEELQDLLCSKKDSLSIREESGEIKIPGLSEIPVHDTDTTMRCLAQGCANRTTAATAMNSTSSRSHAIFTVYIDQKHKQDSDDYWKSKLQLVDLAGSERIKKTHASGERLKEGININKGLLALGNVISILGDEKTQKNKTHVPYRDSKLTRILQDSLGGNSHTVMIACASPADSNLEETLNSLRYADRARKIKNKPVVNVDPKTAEIMTLKARVQELTMKLINAGLTNLEEEAISTETSSDTAARNKEHAETLEKWMNKCKALEAEVESLSHELRQSVDMAASAAERAIKWEMRCERLKQRLKDLEENMGVDIDMLSSSMVDTSPLVAEQLEKLKAFASRLHESVITDSAGTEDEEGEDNQEEVGGNGDDNDTEEDYDPETREMAKQHTLRRAKLNTQLQELNMMLERKEKLANKYTLNETKMDEMKHQYENNVQQLETEIDVLKKEKDHLSSALEDAKVNTVSNKLSEQRRVKVQELETRMGDLKKQLVEHKRILKLKEQKEKEATKMTSEIVVLKQQRVKLMKQMKEDGDSWRRWRQQKDKEVLQLQQKDRRKQFEIKKLQRENERTQSVLHRKSEEAAAANRRLKEAMAKQKRVMEDRSNKFDKCDKTAMGDRIRKWLSHELDVKVGVMEAKYHRESQLQVRKTLSESLRQLKDTIEEGAVISEETKSRILDLENQIELRNVQISDLQQKILDAEQESKGKSARDNLHTMMEAKIGLKWLLDQAVSYKADSQRVRGELGDLQQAVKDDDRDNDEYILELEDRLDKLQHKHNTTVLDLQRQHQQQIEIVLASTSAKATDSELQKRLDIQKEELGRLSDLEEQLKLKTIECDKLEKRLTRYMHQGQGTPLLPRLPGDNTPNSQKSPSLSPEPKTGGASSAGEDSSEDEAEDVPAGDNSGTEDPNDPDWQKTPLFKQVPRQRTNKRRRTLLIDQENKKPKRVSDGKGCHCRLNCKTKRCTCRKNGVFCSDTCGCLSCMNTEVQMPTSTMADIESMDDEYSDYSGNENSVGTSALNTTFEVEPSVSAESSGSDSKSASSDASSKPPRPKRHTSAVSLIKQAREVRSSDEFEPHPRQQKSVLGVKQESSATVDSPDEFVKPRMMKKSVSAGMMRQKRSSSELKLSSDNEDVDSMLESFTKKKRKLHNPKSNFFSAV